MLNERLDSDVEDERVVGQLETKAPDVARENHTPVVRQLSTYSVGLLITRENLKDSRKSRALYSRDQMGSGRCWDPHVNFPLRYRQHDSRRCSA